MLSTEEVELQFTDDGLREIAHISSILNQKMENIGARRLHTVVERVLQDISFRAPNLKQKVVVIDRAYIQDRLKNVLQDEDVTRYIL
jgi:ATP-dependent HslUV protease ATP-binding subunit HslU